MPKLKLITFFVAVSFCSLHSKPMRFDARDLLQRDLLVITSDNVLEKVVGICNAVSGWIELDPLDLAAGIRGEWEADLRLIETGDIRKNYSMQEKLLGVGEYPIANLRITKFISSSRTSLKDQVPVTAKVESTLTWRAITKAQDLLLSLNYLKQGEKTAERIASGNLLRMSTGFDLVLSNFMARVPDGLKFTLAPTLQVSLDAVGVEGSSFDLQSVSETSTQKKKPSE